jgi:hypothetical protein
MLHAFLYTICFVCCYTSWRFMHFPELTHKWDATVPVPYFCCFSILEKLHRKYSWNLTKQKPEFLFFPKRHGVQSRDGGVLGGGHTMPLHGPPWPHRALVWALGPHSDAALPPIYSPRLENLKGPINFHETYCKPPPSSMRDREGPEPLPDTLSEREITTEGLLHHHACLWSDAWVVYLGLRVHSSS